MVSNETQSRSAENPMSLRDLGGVIKRFNRNTTWVATGLLGSVIFAAAMVAIRDHHDQTKYITSQATQNTNAHFSDSSPAAISDQKDSNEKSTNEIVSEQARSLDGGITPPTNHVEANVSSWSQVLGKDFARVIRAKIHNIRVRSSVRHAYVDVKARLIALWHQSLQDKKSPGWILSSSSNKWRNKRISYTAATSH